MEPEDSFVGRVAAENDIVAALRRIGEGRERLIAVKDGIGVVDVLGHPAAFETADLTRVERTRIAGATVYHNHPAWFDGSGRDQSFSLSDVLFGRIHRAEAICVVTERHLYRMAPDERGWRRSLGQNRFWLKDFERILEEEAVDADDLDASLHRAWERFALRMGLAYS